MIGKRINKTDQQAYLEAALWCRTHNGAVADKGDFYEVVDPSKGIPLSEADIEGELVTAVQRHMDAKAKEKRYDNIMSACSYENDSNTTFAREAAICKKWRSDVWSYCYKALDDYKAGKRGIPTADQLIAELPKLEW